MSNQNLNKFVEENKKIVFSINTKRDYFIDWLTNKILPPDHPSLKKVLDKLPNKRFSDGLNILGVHPEEPQLIFIRKPDTNEESLFFNIITIGENRLEVSAGYIGNEFNIFTEILIMVAKTYREATESIVHYLESEMMLTQNTDEQISKNINIKGNVENSAVISGNWNIINIYPNASPQQSEMLNQLPNKQESFRWDILFENDEEGNQIKGKLEKLIEAANQNYPIKIKIYLPNNVTKIIEAETINVDNRTVHAMNTKEISLAKDNNGNYFYQKEAYHYYVIASSNGSFHERSVYLNGKDRNTKNGKRHMVWSGFVPPNFMTDQGRD